MGHLHRSRRRFVDAARGGTTGVGHPDRRRGTTSHRRRGKGARHRRALRRPLRHRNARRTCAWRSPRGRVRTQLYVHRFAERTVTPGLTESSDSFVLALERISKRFGSTNALEDVSFTVRAGTVHALLGENGAGKTTLMRVAFGLTSPDTGDVVAGTPSRRITSAAGAIAAKLGMVHQHFTNVPAMTVAENVALGGHGRFELDAAIATVDAIGARTGLTLNPRAVVADLPVGG